MLESLNWYFLAKLSGTLFGAWTLGTIIYNIYFHPLAKIPGPRLYAASKLPFLFFWVIGEPGHVLERFHKRYGPAVRYTPNEVSFITSQAWFDIYDHERHRIFLKDRRMYGDIDTPNSDPSIVSTDDHVNHARQRRLMSHAFSDKAVREQESIIKVYVDLLISKLGTVAGKPINIVEWYNWTTFDLIGDLAYGEAFGCLENTGYHLWVSMIFDSMAGASFLAACNHLYPLDRIVRLLVPKKLMDTLKWRDELGRNKLERRKRSQSTRKDFFAYILRQDGHLKMTDSEMENNSIIFIIAGSETTATLLSGCTYLLLKNPDCMAKLVEEIRAAFQDESEISMARCGELKYLTAVLTEASRLYPPVPMGLARTASQDAVVDGYLIPKGVSTVA
jgi:cytochrome P450